MKLVFLFLKVPHQYQEEVFRKWRHKGFPPLLTYAPYAAHVLTVELFFQIALGARLISSERPSNRCDIGYLFYLPFSMIFVSSDRLHRACAPLFLRENQEFVWGEELKADLKRLNDRYAVLPEHEREKGIMKLAPHPPEEEKSLVAQIWDRHLRSWRGKSKEPSPRDPSMEKELVEKLTRFSQAPTLPDVERPTTEDVDLISIQRKVQKRKGSWWQLPKDLQVTQ